MSTAWCANCGDEFAPVEYRPADIDDPNFCSDGCESEFTSAEEFTEVYRSAGFSAPVF